MSDSLAMAYHEYETQNLWSVPESELDEAIEAATLLAIADQERAGVDIITDGEVGRESYFNHFANSLGGVSKDEIGVGVNRRGGTAEVPLVTGEISREHPIELASATFVRQQTRPAREGHGSWTIHPQSTRR
jgi:5-methyltetrahydropteroyltriglutamate--homocysteine methyltransferase